MADPIVHITSGVPDSGTGNITTLGLTIQAQSTATSGQSGPLVQGAVTTGAPGYSTGNTNPLSLDTSGNLRTLISNATLAVTQSGSWTISGTTTVSGTVAATQSGTWNITNITGTISLPTGASTSANQPSNAGIASTTSGQSGTLAMGAATTGAPTYVSGQSNPLSLTLAGALRMDGSGVTQPVSGTVTSNQGGAPWTVKPDGTGWAMTSTSANVNVTNASIAVTGTFWQATQPVSAASLPLPSGAS